MTDSLKTWPLATAPGECWAQGEGPCACGVAPSLLSIADTDGFFKRVNSAFVSTLGHSETDLLSRAFVDFVHPNDRTSTMNELARLSTGVPAAQFENRFRHADGSYRWLMWHANLLAKEGRLYLMALDVTKRRQLAARLVQVEERERRRIATGLHDDVGQTLLEAKMSLDQQPQADILKARRLLDRAILMTRELTFELAAPVLYDVGLGAALLSECEQEEKRHGIRFKPPGQLERDPIPVEMRVVLYRAGRELIRNVVKHSRARVAKVSLSVSASQVELTVEDDGCGMDNANGARGHDANAGFGLFSINQELESIGGRLVISSSPGAGTRAVVTAPLDARTERA